MPSRDEPDPLFHAFEDLLVRGPVSAKDATRYLGISQATFSRLVARHHGAILTVGRARATRYMAARSIPDTDGVVPLFEVLSDGRTRQLGVLHAVRPRAYFYESHLDGTPSGFFDDLPYFLHELRPAGFLGRLVPRLHSELGFASDVQLWTSDNVVAYASRYGFDLPGNLILGRGAFRTFMAQTQIAGAGVPRQDRAHRYPALAESILSGGTPGSSAAGEQPKFLTNREGTPVLVKFSPPVSDPVGRRIGDLLIAEHLALETLRAHGQSAARAEVIAAAGRYFLEVERFDRLPGGGRRGVISLFPLDAHFVGRLSGWSDSARALARQGFVSETDVQAIRWREIFGHLIANTDMHAGNLSFFMEGLRVIGLAPAYDMGPALYAPRQGELPTRSFQPPLPDSDDAGIWGGVCQAAQDFWDALANHPNVSPQFQTIARANVEIVARQSAFGRLLPSPAGNQAG